MIDVDDLIRDELAELTPQPAGDPDWRDVQRRAGMRVGRRRALLVAAVAAGVFAVAALAASPFGGYGRWLVGEPGTPASSTAQRAFERQIRQWRGFPQNARLRQLLETSKGGAHFVLYGFRGSGTLCLRLIVTGTAHVADSECAPLALLRQTNQPAWVLAADQWVGQARFVHQGPFVHAQTPFSVTFGVAADGVTRVSTAREGARSDALVGGDAFLAIADGEAANRQTTRIVAYDGTRSVSVRFEPTPTLYGRTSGQLTRRAVAGPAHVQRQVRGGSIRWFARRQPRGEAVPKHASRIAGVPTRHSFAGLSRDVTFARIVTPDPHQPERMLLSLRPAGTQYFGGRLRNNRSFCAELVGGPVAYGGGCWPAGRIFSTEPFAWGLSQTTTGGQGRVLAGVASDDVARLRLFTATGRSARVPLRDNAYFVTFEAGELPVRLVAYDRAGLVIGVKELYPPGVPGVAPSATAAASMVVATKAGSAWIQRSHGTTCLGFLVRGGPSGGINCNHGTLPALPSHALAVQLSSTVDRPGVLGVTGRVGRGIATVRLVYEDGRASRLTPVGGYVIATVPAGGVGTAGVGAILGLDEAGRTVAVEELAH